MRSQSRDSKRHPLPPLATQIERGPEIWVPAECELANPEPRVVFRTLNGFRIWPVSLPEGVLETESLRIRRGFVVQAPGGECCQVAVDITTAVRGFMRSALGRDVAPEDPMWDYLCRSALCRHLRSNGEPPECGLLLFGLTRDQIESACCMAR